MSLTALLLLGASWHLTPDGWGPVRIGMSRAQVERAIGAKLEGEPLEDEQSCIEMAPVGPDTGVWFMFEDFKLSRISVGDPSKVTTPRGIGVGASADQVRRVYPRIKAEPHYYEDKPSEYLTFWTVPNKRGVRFETSSKRQVQAIHAGTASIQYVEGCA